MKVLQFPLARVTLVFIIGILAAYYFKPSPNLVFILLGLSSTLFLGGYFLCKKSKQFQLFFGLTTAILSFVIGLCTQIIQNESNNKNHFTHIPQVFDNPHEFQLVLREKLKSSIKNDRYVVLIEQIDSVFSSGKIIMNVKKDSLQNELEIGNKLKLIGTIYANSAPRNPYQFDYGKYLENKQIYGQLYANKNQIQISLESQKDIWYYTSKIRNTIVSNLKKAQFNSAELHVAVALLLGQQQDIDPEIIKDYQYAGAVHILSVSGLHIGFILMFVNFILKPLPNHRKGSFLKLILIWISLWSFAVLAGLAPSVVRSVTMFSFVALGQHLRRSVNIYHTLMVSFFLILLVQPSFLFDVGFQLSYLALFFIVWFQPVLSKIWKPKNKITLYFWNILTVSFAAQIGTLPLSLYYFHQFPGLFFITNLILLPVVGFIMGLGVLVMILALFDSCPLFLSQLLEKSIWLVDYIIHWIASFQGFVLKDIPFSSGFLGVSYAIIFSGIYWLLQPKFKRLVIVLLSIIGLQLLTLYERWQVQQQEEWIVFHVKKNTLITNRVGKNVTLFGSDSLLQSGIENQNLKAYLVGNSSQLMAKKKIQNMVFFKGNKILIVDQMGILPSVQPDIVVLTQSPKINLDRLIQKLHPKTIVADGSNFKSLQKQWKSSCLKQKIPFHATSEKGFYILR